LGEPRSVGPPLNAQFGERRSLRLDRRLVAIRVDPLAPATARKRWFAIVVSKRENSMRRTAIS